MSIQSYWSQLSIIPGRLFKAVNNVCRAFLWKGKSEFIGPGHIAWDKLCIPKKAGGLGIRNLVIWNKVAALKHIWDVDKMKESLWIQWIHHVYLKQGNIWEHEAPLTSSWQWRKFMEVKAEVKEKHRQKIGDVYKIAVGYKVLLGEHERVYWSSQVWRNIPKHYFIIWLAIQNRLQTRERSARFIGNMDTSCVFCQRQEETKEHLFFLL